MYPVIDIGDQIPELLEQLGNKAKYWFRADNRRYLFKIGRPGTGENWAEKTAAELADLLGLPHAVYDFAVWHGRRGVWTPSIEPEGARLILGNELLAAIHTGYPRHQIRRAKDHTLGRIHALLSRPEITAPPDWPPPGEGIVTAYDVFVGYLLLDAWIANQDRHHENWGVINHQDRIYLAPTFDHAASMGQNETDETRHDRLTTRDRGRHISSYVSKARSAIYGHKDSKKPLPNLELFEQAARKSPAAARIWLTQLERVRDDQCQSLFEELPPEEASSLAREFALTLLSLNRSRMLTLEP
ncbi:MAG: phosphatidylinositol kinase [Pseudomonadota bacterium]|nr:phosphatidylinositol kinase [Pseudomonadota bacterium]